MIQDREPCHGGGPTGPPPLAPEEVLDHPDLMAVLTEARARGLLGPVPLGAQITHSLGFALGPDLGPGGSPAGERLLVTDLGAGGGLPGLVLAVARPAWSLVLVDAVARRCRWLEEAAAHLGVSDRVEVLHSRAEDLGRTDRRGASNLVVARSFGPPAVTAECAAPLLCLGGTAIVSEPPDDRSPGGEREGPRWDGPGLARLGMELGPRWVSAGTFQALYQRQRCPDTFPRRAGVPKRRPLWV